MRLREEPQERAPLPFPDTVRELPTRDIDRYRNRRRLYLPVRLKFGIAMLCATGWAGLSLVLAQPWAGELGAQIGAVPAWIVIAGIALVPGFMNAFLVSSLLLDQRPTHVRLLHYPPLTVLIAAYNEARTILETLESIAQQGYPGELEVIVINDGSQDRTAELVREKLALWPWLRLLDLEKNAGKANALNQGLKIASHELILTVDADSWLFRNALSNIVERYQQDPENTRVIAGSVMVRNSRHNLMTRVQEWDYFLGIAAVKRVQSLYQGTMVAQGAFSLYDRKTVEAIGGWQDCVGEDIVLSWAILKQGYRIGHCEDALLFTDVPTTAAQFARQRKRWARGMVEAIKRHPGILLAPRLSTVFVYWNLVFPLLDLVFTVAFVPGLIAALFGYYWIVGPVTLALVPMAMMMNYFIYRAGHRTFLDLGLRVRFNLTGFLVYSLFYSFIMQPVSLSGYLAELLNQKKSWGTK